MAARDITITEVTFKDYLWHVVELISKKYFVNPNAFTKVALVNTNNVDIGIIGLNISDDVVEITLFQAPHVCRMSILSLIDSSIYFLQSIVKPTDTIRFKSVHYAHTFKLKQLMPDIIVDEDDYLISGEKLLTINMATISLKKILLEKIE